MQEQTQHAEAPVCYILRVYCFTLSATRQPEQASCLPTTRFKVLETHRWFHVFALQQTIVLDGVPSAAISSLQGVGYLPVEVAFSLGTDALSNYRYIVRPTKSI